MKSEKILSREREIFVGRVEERKILSDYFEKFVKGNGHFILVSGVEGIGKTSLINHFIQGKLNNSQYSFFKEKFYADSVGEPFAPFLRILIKLGSSYADSFFGKVKNIVLHSSEHDWDAPINLEAFYRIQLDWTEVQEIIIREILQASKNAPIVVYLQDLFAATEVDWKFIVKLVDRIQSFPILILGDMRLDGEIDDSDKIPVYSQYLKQLSQLNNFVGIRLQPFCLVELKEYIYHLYEKTDFDIEFLENLLRLSIGIPRVLQEILEKLKEKGIIYQQNGVWYNRSKDYEELLKLTAEHSILNYLQKCYEESGVFEKQILNLLSMMGELPEIVLQEILQTSSKRLNSVLKKLETRKLVYWDNNNVYLRNPQFKYVIRQKIPAASFKNLNKEIARALWNVQELAEVRRYWLLGKHFLMADEKKIAFKHFHTAGDIFLFNYDFSNALKAYNNCLSIIREFPEFLELPDAFEVISEAAWIKRLTGNFSEALKLTKFAKNTAFYKNNKFAKLIVNLHQLFLAIEMQNWELAGSIIKVLVKDATAREDAFLSGLIYYAYGLFLLHSGKFQQSLKQFVRALKIAERSGQEAFRALVNMRIGEVKYWIGRFESASSYFQNAYELYSKLNFLYEKAEAALNSARALAELKEWAEADNMISACLSLCDKAGLDAIKIKAFLHRALILHRLEQFAKADEYFQKAVNLLELKGIGTNWEYFHLMASYFLLTGNLEKAHKLLTDALSSQNIVTSDFCKARLFYDLAKVYHAQGKPEMAKEQLEIVRKLYMDKGVKYFAEKIDLNTTRIPD